MAYGDQAVLQSVAILYVIVGVVSGNERDAQFAAEGHEALDPARVTTNQILLDF